MVEVKAPVTEVVPKNTFRLKIYNLVKSSFFENLITVFIMLNTIVICMDFYGSS